MIQNYNRNIKFLKIVCFALLSIIFLSACSSKKPILNTKITKEKLKTLTVDKQISDKDDVSLILTFSGGGTRAAALSYGVLKELKNQKLLKEVDVISSVSGGSFTSAYYGLYGEKIFEDFEDKFLKKPVQSELINAFLNPFNWFSLSLSNRSDYVAAYYEKEIFGEKTFGDLRNNGPKIIINATDVSTGNAFAFSPENFHRICSDWETYPIGRAVTASSAVPVVFSPITLRNYEGCPPLFQKKERKAFLPYNDKQSLQMRKYQDKENYKYLHLVDGGIADNLGIRSLLHIIAELDNDFLKVMDRFGIPNSEKVALVVVNAADRLNPNIALDEESPEIETVLDAVSTIQLKRYNTDTLDLITYYFEIWEEQVRKARCSDITKECKEMKFYLVELNFNQLPKKKAKLFSLTETSLELPSKKVDELIQAGETLLKNSTQFNQLLNDLKK